MVRKKSIKGLARAGLIAKGTVYVLLGVLAFMSAFELGGATEKSANQSGIFKMMEKSAGGTVLLAVLSAGLLCYCVWRFIQAFNGADDTKMAKRLRYFFSGLAYCSLTFSALRLLWSHKGGGDKYQEAASSFLSKPWGTVLLIAGAILIACIGVYQAYYGLSEKHKKHLSKLRQPAAASRLLLAFGKAGYVSRGIVWLLISILLFRSALQHRASEAGNTGKAFQLVEHGPLGSYFLGAIGIGLVTYGIFNFVRARAGGE